MKKTISFLNKNFKTLERAHKAVEVTGKLKKWSTMKIAGQKAKLTREWNKIGKVKKSAPTSPHSPPRLEPVYKQEIITKYKNDPPAEIGKRLSIHTTNGTVVTVSDACEVKCGNTYLWREVTR